MRAHAVRTLILLERTANVDVCYSRPQIASQEYSSPASTLPASPNNTFPPLPFPASTKAFKPLFNSSTCVVPTLSNTSAACTTCNFKRNAFSSVLQPRGPSTSFTNLSDKALRPSIVHIANFTPHLLEDIRPTSACDIHIASQSHDGYRRTVYPPLHCLVHHHCPGSYTMADSRPSQLAD
jgi:hypothetical protein